MKLAKVLSLIPLFGSVHAEDTECKEKTSTCQTRVEVLATDLVFGLKDDVPVEVYEAFVTASSQCLSCVEDSDVKILGGGTGDGSKLSRRQCKNRGCSCCDKWWCQHSDGSNWCPEQCLDRFPKCKDERRRLTGQDDGTNPYFVNYELDVCMDDISPLETTTSSYVDYNDMLIVMESDLATCYDDKEVFLDSWSSLCTQSGIDLSLMARTEGDTSTIMFGATGFDAENAVVTTYTSDESHRSTSHMIFYSALGFVTLSAFAIIGTALVVRVLNKRKEEEAAQAAQWVSEMATVETVNPISTA